ncbi:protein of unknown function [Methylacidimicrobium sp. AP8]|nr:protein of unknown function [Methylacidimicrobium sp. AP8]
MREGSGARCGIGSGGRVGRPLQRIQAHKYVPHGVDANPCLEEDLVSRCDTVPYGGPRF